MHGTNEKGGGKGSLGGLWEAGVDPRREKLRGRAPGLHTSPRLFAGGWGEGAELRADADAWKWMRSVLDKRGETWLPGAYPEALAGQARPKRQCVCHESATIQHPHLSR